MIALSRHKRIISKGDKEFVLLVLTYRVAWARNQENKKTAAAMHVAGIYRVLISNLADEARIQASLVHNEGR